MQETHDDETIVCPHCAYRLRDPDEYFSPDREDAEVECPECDKEFFASRVVSVSYRGAVLAGRS